MDNTEKAEFYIEVSAADSTVEDIDRMTRQLLSELRETDVESVELVKNQEVPRGTKSAHAVTVGSIVGTTTPQVLPSLIGLTQMWAARGQGRTVKFKGRIGGEIVEFEGPPEEWKKHLETLSKGKKI